MKQAKRHELLSKTDLAGRFGVEERTVDNWVAAGMQRRKTSGRYLYSWQDCLRWREGQIREDERALRHAGGNEDTKKQMADAKVRTALAEAAEAELNLAARRGELVSLDFMQSEFGRIARNLRARLLSMPQSWAPRLGACLTTIDRQIVLQDAINELMPQLRELADDDEAAVIGADEVSA